MVGSVGAGSLILPFDEYAPGQGYKFVESPEDAPLDCVAVEVKGDSMYPIEDGWLLFYRRTQDGVPDECVNKLCVLKVVDGPTLVKRLRKGSKPGSFSLESWNAPAQFDVQLEWAARVLDIRPT